MVKKIIVANWKMNPSQVKDAVKLFTPLAKAAPTLKGVEVIICPPVPFLSSIKQKFPRTSLILGAQDCHQEQQGAFTGEYSASMLADLGVKYVILGHSERRQAGDTDAIINAKVKAALKKGLSVILCIGEKERDDHGDYLKVLAEQLEGDLTGISKSQCEKIIIAYEPVWAIGVDATGSDTPETFHHNVIFIRKVLTDLKGRELSKIRVLYGGSVSVKNAVSFLTEGKADGLLVGRESLNPERFITIAKMARE